MVLVEGATFRMGCEDGKDDEMPVHRVSLDSFYISRYEVTQGEYESVMGSNPSGTTKGIGDDYPVNKVNWYEAVEYCNSLSRREGLKPCYSGSGDNIRCDFNADGYRLPTEAEWEFAARGGILSGGFTYSGGNELDSLAWFGDNSGEETHPVGGKQANELGIYDMSGNVWEWCWDWYGSYKKTRNNPKGSSKGTIRVMRGGSWYNYTSLNRSTHRYGGIPSYGGSNLGIRLVRRQ